MASGRILKPGELQPIIAELQANACELDDLEVKAARWGTPAKLCEDLCAFTKSRGGALLFGVHEAQGLAVVGVGNAQQLQADLATAATL